MLRRLIVEARAILVERNYNPWQNKSSRGPGPGGRTDSASGKWKCKKTGQYQQTCVNSKGVERIVDVDPGKKAAYNKKHRKDFWNADGASAGRYKAAREREYGQRKKGRKRKKWAKIATKWQDMAKNM